jgi:hypothetical protein
MLREAIKVEIKLTDAACALMQARPELSNKAAAILLAQLLFETANFKSCYNYNIGNIKSVEGDGRNYTYYNETLDGTGLGPINIMFVGVTEQNINNQ